MLFYSKIIQFVYNLTPHINEDLSALLDTSNHGNLGCRLSVHADFDFNYTDLQNYTDLHVISNYNVKFK